MKPFLGIDLTDNNKNTQMNGDTFLVAIPSQDVAHGMTESALKADEIIGASKLPLVVRIIQWVCGTTAALIAVGVLKAFGESRELTYAQAYQNAPELFWIGGIGLLVWLILAVMAHIKKKYVLERCQGNQAFDEAEKACTAVFEDLAVPADAYETDVLSFYYKLHHGEVKACEKGLQAAKYDNPVFKLYADQEYVYLVSLEGKYAFPLSSFKRIRTVNKSVVVARWNKEKDPGDSYYRSQRIIRDGMGRWHCKPYYIVELTYNGEEWGIYIPCYEVSAFENLIGLKAQP